MAFLGESATHRGNSPDLIAVRIEARVDLLPRAGGDDQGVYAHDHQR